MQVAHESRLFAVIVVVTVLAAAAAGSLVSPAFVPHQVIAIRHDVRVDLYPTGRWAYANGIEPSLRIGR